MSNKLITKVSCKYGAPMGRMTNASNTEAKVRLFRVRIDSGGYDVGGAYWGLGKPLYAALGDGFECYVRADNRNQAKKELLDKYPDLTFYR